MKNQYDNNIGIEFKKYDEVEFPVNKSDCLNIQVGIFETEKTKIIRTINKQQIIFKQTGKSIEMDIEWVSECEFKFQIINNPDFIGYVKISDVNESRYIQYSSGDKKNGNKEIYFIKEK